MQAHPVQMLPLILCMRLKRGVQALDRPEQASAYKRAFPIQNADFPAFSGCFDASASALQNIVPRRAASAVDLQNAKTLIQGVSVGSFFRKTRRSILRRSVHIVRAQLFKRSMTESSSHSAVSPSATEFIPESRIPPLFEDILFVLPPGLYRIRIPLSSMIFIPNFKVIYSCKISKYNNPLCRPAIF